MQTTIHKKSLLYSLKENKIKVKQNTKWLIFFSLLMSITSLINAFTVFKIDHLIVFFSGCAIYLSYTIFTLWQKNKKIKEKLKTL